MKSKSGREGVACVFRLRSHGDYSVSEEQSYPTVWEDVDLFPMGKKKDEEKKPPQNPQLYVIMSLSSEVSLFSRSELPPRFVSTSLH